MHLCCCCIFRSTTLFILQALAFLLLQTLSIGGRRLRASHSWKNAQRGQSFAAGNSQVMIHSSSEADAELVEHIWPHAVPYEMLDDSTSLPFCQIGQMCVSKGSDHYNHKER